MIQLQYDLFEEIPDELTELRQIVIEMKAAGDRQRKAMFAKIGASGKEIIEIIEKNHQLEHRIANLEKMLSK